MNEKDVLKSLPMEKLFPFMKLRFIFIAISVLFVGLSLYFIFVQGLNFGVDFKGGTKIIYHFNQSVSDGQIRKALEPLKIGDVQVVAFGEEKEHSFMVKVKELEGRNISKEMTTQLKSKFGEASFSILSEEVVGPRVGADLRQRGMFALILTWALILLYVGFRFDFMFAPGAVISLIHDVIIATGFFAFFGKEFNLPILAALLTIIGYSVNDTIIIYDRVRENVLKLDKKIGIEKLIDISINETLSRTIITSLTVLFVAIVLYFFGGAVLEDFAFCMIVGVVAGTYSTIFIASPIYLILQKMWPNKGLAKNHRV